MKPHGTEPPPPPAAGVRSQRTARDGVLIVDKPRGPTSHDVVARLRRLLGEKRIGHAGTLDPMATGVMVVLVGEATKLAPYLTAHDKRYEARVALGVATDTLDADGEVTATAPLPSWLEREIDALAWGGSSLAEAAPRIAAALDAERARVTQTPPAHSAIKVAGRRSYALARAGEAVDLTPRPVTVRSFAVLGAGRLGPGGLPSAAPAAAFLDIELDVSKGYYVRSLARDLAAHLGVPAHLSALRRTASGAFSIDRALPLDAGADALRAALCPLQEAAAQSLPVARLTEHGARRARLGQPLDVSDFSAAPPATDVSVWLDPRGQVVALGAPAPGREGPSQDETAQDTGRFSVVRGFAARPGEPEPPDG